MNAKMHLNMVMMLTNGSQVKEDLQYVHISLMEPLKKTKIGVGGGDERIASSLRKQKNVYQYDKTARLKQDGVSLTFTEKVSCGVGSAGGYGS